MDETRKIPLETPRDGLENKVNQGSYSQPDLLIPGGWELRRFGLGKRSGMEREIAFWLPADPDAFLDDAQCVASHGPTEENPQRDDIPFWQHLWPASETMSHMLFAHDWAAAGFSQSTPALELGAGVGLVGLAGLAAGFSVTFSDYQADALTAAETNARQNGFTNFNTQVLDWNQPTPEQFPFIFGCEVLYERAIHEPILNVLDQMLALGGLAWLADPGRSKLPLFLEDAKNRGYRVELQNARGEMLSNPSFGEYHLVVLAKTEQRSTNSN